MVRKNVKFYINMMLGSKAPNHDAYGLFRAAHSHIYTPFRSVLNARHWRAAPIHPTFMLISGRVPRSFTHL